MSIGLMIALVYWLAAMVAWGMLKAEKAWWFE